MFPVLLGLFLAIEPPGVVIDHSPQESGEYIGSPSLAVLPNGDYVASHDLFGPKSGQKTGATSRIFRSRDKGRTWTHQTDVKPAFWSSLFTHKRVLYLLGTSFEYGDILIRKSTDGGATWTEPVTILKGQYHCAPMPVVEHKGRLWRPFEDASNGTPWGVRFQAMMLSIPKNANLLDTTQWTASNKLPRDPAWLDGKFTGWLEGNFVVARDGSLWNYLRVAVPGGDKAAAVRVSADGATVSFDETTGFVPLPGGDKKFEIHYDRKSKRYWSLVNRVMPEYAHHATASVRNTLSLISSADLRDWRIHADLLHHPDHLKHGFQYADWRFEGNDIIAVVRTAFDDAGTGAHNAHDANYMTFHRFKDFRTLR